MKTNRSTPRKWCVQETPKSLPYVRCNRQDHQSRRRLPIHSSMFFRTFAHSTNVPGLAVHTFLGKSEMSPRKVIQINVSTAENDADVERATQGGW